MSKRATQAKPATQKTRIENGTMTGQSVETERAVEVANVRGQTTKSKAAFGEGSDSFISAIVGHAKTLTVHNLNINVNTNSPATSAISHTD